MEDSCGGGSTSQGRRSRGGGRGSMKPSQTRRVWTTREEEVLIVAMKDLLSKGWKSDNGFRAGYLNKLEAKIIEKFPGTDLRATPHIHSKLMNWKRTHASLSGALARTEVGYNERTNMLDCEDETWNLVVKADNNAENLRYKSFPYFPIWAEFFGKDRANGQTAEDVLDAFSNLLKEDMAAGITPTDDDLCDPDVDENGDNVECNSVCGGDRPQGTSNRDKKKKRKLGADSDSKQLRELVGSIVSTNNELKDMTRFMGYEHGLGQKREMIFNMLSTVAGLTDLDRYDLVIVLGKDSDQLEVFSGLPEEHKKPFLDRLMQTLGR